jgi:hypothetical protein
MLAKPNRTIIEGAVRAIKPAKDGVGHDFEIAVHRNLSLGHQEDFIQPVEGHSLHLFAAEQPNVAVGDLVRVQARLLGGPFGERTVVERVEPLSKQPKRVA